CPVPPPAAPRAPGCHRNTPCAAIPQRNPAGPPPAPARGRQSERREESQAWLQGDPSGCWWGASMTSPCMSWLRSEEHTSELQSRENLVCRLLLEKKK